MGPESPSGPRIIVQARMGSTRLPGKIAADLAGRTMLERLVDRLATSFLQVVGTKILIATTHLPEDDETAALCAQIGVDCVRGEVDDVLGRFLLAAADLPDDATALRATADNPAYCLKRSRLIWESHCQSGADYTCIDGLSYVVPEVFRVGALREMARRATEPYCREHVTPYFRRHPGEFKMQALPANWLGLRPEVRLTVDTPAELDRMRKLYALMGQGDRPFPLERVYELYDAGQLVA